MGRREVSERALAGLLLVLATTVGILAGIVLERTLLRPYPGGPDTTASSRRPPPEPAARTGPDGTGVDTAPVGGRPDARPSRERAEGALDRRLGLPGEGDFLGWLDARLELSPRQRERLEVVIERRREELRRLGDSVRPRFQEIVRGTRRDVRQVLTPEQVRELRRALGERSRRRPGAGPPPP